MGLSPYPMIETERLLLRPLQSDDAEQIQRLFPRWEIVRHLSDKVPWPYPDDGARYFVDNIALPQIAKGGLLVWSLRLKDKPENLMGVIHLELVGEKNRGFWLAPEWQGCGYMTEATEAVTDYWFTTLQQCVLRTVKRSDNAASRRISERTGMRLAGHSTTRCVGGEVVDTDVWDITREEWLAHKDRRRVSHYVEHAFPSDE